MFLSCVSANETADVQASESITDEPLALHDDKADTLSNENVDDIQVDDNVGMNESIQNTSEEYNQSSKGNESENVSTNQNAINRSIVNNSVDRKEIDILYDNIIHLSKNDYKKVCCIMKEIREDDFDVCYGCLMRHDFEKLRSILEQLDDDEYYTLYMMVWDLIHGNMNYDMNTHNNNYLVKSASTHITSNNYKSHYIKSHKKFYNSYKNYKKYSFCNKIVQRYILLSDLIDEYLEKEISLEEFLNGLKSIGYNIDDLVFNDDETISWRGATIPAPYGETGADYDVSYDDKVNVNELGENTNNVEEHTDDVVSSTSENSTI